MKGDISRWVSRLVPIGDDPLASGSHAESSLSSALTYRFGVSVSQLSSHSLWSLQTESLLFSSPDVAPQPGSATSGPLCLCVPNIESPPKSSACGGGHQWLLTFCPLSHRAGIAQTSSPSSGELGREAQPTLQQGTCDREPQFPHVNSGWFAQSRVGVNPGKKEDTLILSRSGWPHLRPCHYRQRSGGMPAGRRVGRGQAGSLSPCWASLGSLGRMVPVGADREAPAVWTCCPGMWQSRPRGT